MTARSLAGKSGRAHSLGRTAQVQVGNTSTVCSISIEDRIGGDSTVHQEVTAGDNATVRTHEHRADRSQFVWISCGISPSQNSI